MPPLLLLVLISGLASAMAMPSSRWLLPNQLQEPYYYQIKKSSGNISPSLLMKIPYYQIKWHFISVSIDENSGQFVAQLVASSRQAAAEVQTEVNSLFLSVLSPS